MNTKGITIAVLGGILLIGAPLATEARANADLIGAVGIIDQKPATPSVNTVLVFTNTSNEDVDVKMAATNAQGEHVGQHTLTIPPRGLRFVFVSEFIAATHFPFVGFVESAASRRIHGNAILLGLGATDLPSRNRPYSRQIFPVTAAY